MSPLSKALYPGTFDLLTNGHMDIIRRGARLVETLVVAVAINDEKRPLFSPHERADILRQATRDLANVTVDLFKGLTVDYAKAIGAQAIIRGLRFVSDFEYELQMALFNRSLSAEVETLFLAPTAEFSFISSSMVREIASRHGEVAQFVPPAMAEALKGKFGAKG